MEQSHSQADSLSTSQEISLLLWDMKVHYRVRKSLPMIPILSQMNTVHNFQFCFS